MYHSLGVYEDKMYLKKDKIIQKHINGRDQSLETPLFFFLLSVKNLTMLGLNYHSHPKMNKFEILAANGGLL